LHQPQLAVRTLDEVLKSPTADANALLQVAQQLAGLNDYPRLEATLDKLTKLVPASPEAWYDLAALRSILGKPTESLQALRQALRLSAERLIRDPKARDLSAEVQPDPRFNPVRSLPEFKTLTTRKP
jgi:tetratricopeptide (TPR) repeat protein